MLFVKKSFFIWRTFWLVLGVIGLLSGLFFRVFEIPDDFVGIKESRMAEIILFFVFFSTLSAISGGVMISKKIEASRRALRFAFTACELEDLGIVELDRLFHPLLNDVSISEIGGYAARFVYGLKHLGTLDKRNQELIKFKLQEVFDSCLHELAVRFFKADKAQTAFRKKLEGIEKEDIQIRKGTMSDSEIKALYREKDALQKELDEAKNPFNMFRNNVKELGYRTWPHYKVYVTLM